MTPEVAFRELLARVGAAQGVTVLVTAQELGEWPAAAVAAMKAQKLLTRARPASSVVCPGCERECSMPVHVLPHPTGQAAFVVCDKRSDISRVDVPLSRIEQWQTSGSAIAELLAQVLNLHCSGSGDADTARWEIGMLRGAKHSSHLVLVADGGLTLSLGGHSVALAHVLGVDGDRLAVDRRTLNRLVDQPVGGAGDVESAAQRRERLKKRVRAEKAKGTKAFLKVVADEEGFSTSRLKQLFKEESEPTKPLGWGYGQ